MNNLCPRMKMANVTNCLLSKKNIYGLNFWKGHISKDTGLKIIIFAINKSKLDAFMANEVNFEIL